MKSSLLLAFVLIFCSSCVTPPPNSGTATEVTKILGEIKDSFKSMKDDQQAFIEAQNAKNAKTQETLQYVSDRVFTAQFANNQNPLQNPYTGLVDTNLVLVQKIVPPASNEVKSQSIIDLQQALSKSQKDKDDLAARYAELQKKADDLKATSDKLSAEVEQKKKALEDVTNSANATVTKLADKEGEVRLKAAEAETARKQAQEEAASKARLKVAVVFMSVGGIIIVAAIVATIMHVFGVLLPGLVSGVAMFMIGWLITYVEQLLNQKWFQYTLGGVLVSGAVLFGFVIYRAMKQRKVAAMDSKISTNTIGALQDMKNDDVISNTKTFSAVVPYLNEWHRTTDGAPDKAVQDEIDRRLVTMNLKTAVPAKAQ